MSVRGNMIGQYGKLLNVREYRRGNQKRTIQRNWQRIKTNKAKIQHNMCWTQLYGVEYLESYMILTCSPCFLR
jgi:hypothetical protein